MITEEYIAPVQMQVTWRVEKFNDEWSYEIKMNFSFDKNPEDCIQGEILTELGVYTFNTENHAKIQAKRIAAQYKEYFGEELVKLIEREVGYD